MREIECISRLFKLARCLEELVDFLMEEKILSESDLVNFKLELDKPKFLHTVMKQAVKDEKLILLSFDWVVLPVERIRIQLVTERNKKELTYKY